MSSSPHPLLLAGLGIAVAILGSTAGAASGTGAAASYLLRVIHHDGASSQKWTPKQVLLAMAPIVISGVLAIYGTIIAILIHGKVFSGDSASTVDATAGYKCLTSGLAVGLATCASGVGIATLMTNCCIYTSQKAATTPASPSEQPLLNSTANAMVMTADAPIQPSVYMVLSLVFLEAIGLYGLIVGLFVVGSI